MNPDLWYRPLNELSISTPAILVYPERIEENIRRMISIAGSSQRLRPHVKTHKIPEIVRLQVQKGIRKFKCATLNELEMVARNGGEDILLAYPILGPGLDHFINLMTQFPHVNMTVTVDSMMACRILGDLAKSRRKHVALFVDLDNGMHRTGIEPGKAAEIIDFILDHPYLGFDGLHVYDGHIHEEDFTERKKHCDKAFTAVAKLVNDLEEEGVEIAELACGGTPTFPIHALYESRTLCPGTPILWDAGYKRAIPDLDFLNAAVVVGRVISKPEQNICFDLGHKSVASEMDHPRLHFLDLEVYSVVNHSEEHLVAKIEEGTELLVGNLVYALPIHVCPTMALHEQVYVVQERKVVGTWTVAGRNRTYSL